MSKVSIITPAYNASKYLSDTIMSIQSQSFVDWTLYIVDDGSTDDTFEIASKFAKNDERIKVIKQDNAGVAAARNKAIKIADSKYIAFLDSDDMWTPDKLQKQVAFMESKNCVLSYTYYQAYDSNTGKLGRVFKAPKVMTYKKIFRNTGIGCLTVMVNREMSGPFQMPLLNHTEDNCTWQSILKDGYKAYLLPEVLAWYRVGNDSLSSSKMKSIKLQWYCYREYYKLSFGKSAMNIFFYALNAIKRHYL